jgi:phage shock protein C
MTTVVMERRLRRSPDHRLIGGVIGGIAEYFDRDVVLLRVIYVLVSILSAAFPGIIVYIVLWILIPLRESSPPASASL